ncbi:MAG: glycine cleavage system protein H [Planctomycetota bacterium]|nr:glycine cleavage system protein H [Planctomycetota bacterium]
MSEPLIFMMGEYEAHFPTDRLYAKNHMWARPYDEAFRFGLSAYAVRLLQDVYFLDVGIEPGMSLSLKQEIGSIESKKAESSLYSPTAGQVSQLNEMLLEDPTPINLDKYGDGWIFELECGREDLIDAEQYLEHLESAWEVAQRTIKGQANA